MAVNPNSLEHKSWKLTELYLDIQTNMLLSTADLLKKDKGLLERDVALWGIQKLEQVGALNQKNISYLSKKTGIAFHEFMQLISELGFEGIQTNETLLKKALNAGAPLTEPEDPRNDPNVNSILEAYQRRVANTLNLVNTSLLNQSEQVYRDIINRTTAEVLYGITTPQQALRDTVKEWSDFGIPALIRKDGTRLGVEGYVNMITRTIGNQVTNDMQEARFDSWGIELVEISSHIGARPNCEPYQGRIYSRLGNHPDYDSLYDTSIGEPNGLFGINCRHVQFPYIPGVSTKQYHPVDKERNEEAYKNSQIQRSIERSIRKAKTEIRVLERLGDTEGAKESTDKLKSRQAKMRAFIDKTGRTRRREREQIV